MKRKILSFLLCLSLFVSLFIPANSAFAQGDASQENTEASVTLECVNYTNVAPLSSVMPAVRRINKLTDAKLGTDQSGVETSKTVTKNEDGTYTLRLESYVTGSSMTSVTQKPTDTVLVLDTSGSMDEYIKVADKNSLATLDPEYEDYSSGFSKALRTNTPRFCGMFPRCLRSPSIKCRYKVFIIFQIGRYGSTWSISSATRQTWNDCPQRSGITGICLCC